MNTVLMRLMHMLIAVTMIVTISGCGALRTYEASHKSYDKVEKNDLGKNDVTIKPFEEDEFLVDLANRFGLMALFAETAYRLDLSEDVRDEQGCAYIDLNWPGNAQSGMPKISNSTSGWERWIPKGSGEPPCINDKKSGLYYETYVFRDNGKITEAVIAFRGTENRKGQQALDWETSFAATFGFEPAQYKTARDHLPALIKRLTSEDSSSTVKIYAVGHSLGGGLAQQAGYLSSKISEVFTFNTSPVTNWTALRLNGLVEQGYPIIHRVYHGGEFLETPRFVATSATGARYGRHDVEVQFGQRNAAKGHSMKILACNFAKILSKRDIANGSHNYPKAYIDKYVLQVKDAPATIAAASERPEPIKRICDDEPPEN